MEYSRELLFFFSSLGAFNGFVLACYFLFFAKPKNASNRFLGAMLLALSIRVGKSVFFYFNSDLAYEYLQFGITACTFIGPFLLFYLIATLDSERLQWNWKPHVATTAFFIVSIGILYPWASYPDYWASYFLKMVYFQWLFYILASTYLLWPVLSSLLKKEAIADVPYTWLLSVYFGNILIWSAYYFSAYTSYITGALSFTFLFYLLILQLIFPRKNDASTKQKKEKYIDKNISVIEANKLIEDLEFLMKEGDLYKDSNLKLSVVAKKMNILPHLLSQLLNEKLEKNFPKYINEYRIEAAKKMIKTHPEYTLETIAYECGFNSRSTFYTAFKKETGTTPAKFREKQT